MQTLARIIFFLSTACIAVTAIPSAIANTPEIAAGVRAIERKYNVQVQHAYNTEAYFPARWTRPPISARGGQLSPEEIERLLPLIERFLARYPDTVLQENLETIYLLSELNFYGKSYGATNSRSGLYIKVEEGNAGFSDSFLLERMHSEFSSILMRNYAFPEADWQKINTAKFEYIGSGREVLGQPNLYGQSAKLLSDGFIVRYAQSSLENDFNMISYWLFTRRSELKRLARKYPRIKSKMELAIAFYESVDERFDFQ